MHCRTLTFLYLPARAFWLLLCPSLLSYDWQMTSIPLVSSPADPRILAAAAFYAGLISLCAKVLLGGAPRGDARFESEVSEPPVPFKLLDAHKKPDIYGYPIDDATRAS